ncbi:MAG: hypothetical protein BMS9Abin26_0347 [Gammaproteobacteria bacterium]|nr:MAG: hypothetical protein BMS9Abin26_0347 [Gammaproteobacteria bacterium]
MKTLSSILLLLVFIQSANAITLSDILEDHKLDDDPDTGVIVMNLGIVLETWQFPKKTINLLFRQVDGEFNGKIIVSEDEDKMMVVDNYYGDYEGSRRATLDKLAIYEFPAGKYEIYKFVAIKGYEGSLTRFESVTKNNVVKFTVAPGKITYIGDVKVFVSGDWIRTYYNIVDEHERDLDLLEQRYPQFKHDDVKIAVAYPDNIISPEVVKLENIGMGAIRKGEYKQAFGYFQKAADKGSLNARVVIGKFYLEGLGVEKNYGKAYEIFRSAAEQHNVTAKYYLGILYFFGMGVEKDRKKSLELFEYVARIDQVVALRFIGLIYAIGDGVEKDPVKAYAMFLLALKNNDKISQQHIETLKKKNSFTEKQLGQVKAFVARYENIYLSLLKLRPKH